MSKGVVHVKASLFLAAGFSIGALATQDAGMLECAAGAIVGTIVTPDWDVDKSFIGNAIVKKRLGWFAERVWNFVLTPYKKSFKHGQFASHFPIFSTFVRLFYIYFWIFLFYLLTMAIAIIAGDTFDLNYELIWWATFLLQPAPLIGLICSDIIHWALDILTTERS